MAARLKREEEIRKLEEDDFVEILFQKLQQLTS
jgi:hypothetical protein